jgi:phosphate transport system substrate-binding protein
MVIKIVKESKKNIRSKFILGFVGITVIFSMIISGCTQQSNEETPNLIQTGSSTVLPLAVAWAEEFDKAEISVSGGGSSHGLNALLLGEADLGDSSRILKGSDYEKVGGNPDDVNSDGTAKAPVNDILPTKWIVAYDVLAVVIHNTNTWATQLNYTQLSKIFTDDTPAIYWDEVPGLTTAPREKIEIYAPDEASGTYDYFFESIIPNWGKDNQQIHTRLDLGDGVYHPSADDNVILKAIKDNPYAIGYFGFAYIMENPGQVKVAKIAKTTNYVEASLDNVADYPMARPLHIYTNGIPDTTTAKGNAINEYLKYVLSDEGQDVVGTVGYVKLELVDPTMITTQLAKL